MKVFQNALQDISLTNVRECKTSDFLNYLLEFLIVRAVFKNSKSIDVEKHVTQRILNANGDNVFHGNKANKKHFAFPGFSVLECKM